MECCIVGCQNNDKAEGLNLTRIPHNIKQSDNPGEGSPLEKKIFYCIVILQKILLQTSRIINTGKDYRIS